MAIANSTTPKYQISGIRPRPNTLISFSDDAGRDYEMPVSEISQFLSGFSDDEAITIRHFIKRMEIVCLA